MPVGSSITRTASFKILKDTRVAFAHQGHQPLPASKRLTFVSERRVIT